ncbi:MAG: LysR family transcriptional regulator [Candidatus Protistobacter heckmanni]|nr:LysR family transcriptional regulator [Candidatus Protistobacter heckmanni]
MDWIHRLRLRNLQMLLSFAQTGNMSQSAQALNTTQPGLSKWLKELEDDVWLPLFERLAKGLKPTVYGEAMIAHAQRIESHLNTVREDLSAMREGGRGMVAIGTSGASASDTAPLAVLKLLQAMLEARVRLVESTMDRLLEQLARGDLDIIVGRTAPEHHDPAITTEVLYMEPIHFVARPGIRSSTSQIPTGPISPPTVGSSSPMARPSATRWRRRWLARAWACPPVTSKPTRPCSTSPCSTTAT